jgi:peptide-methionine (S)-S-oxide reductase
MKPTLPAILFAAAAALAFAVSPGSDRHADARHFPAPSVGSALVPAGADQTAYFAGGCFWGIEAVFEHVKGVKAVTSGYAGGTVAHPSYEDVSSGETGHAESVRVVFDPSQVSYGQLLQIFFSVAHDPTEKNRQGPDVGTQYRSIAFYTNEEQHHAILAYVAQLTKASTFPRPIVTEIAPLGSFNDAESYHQNYLESHRTQPYIMINDLPKLGSLKRAFPSLYRDGVSGS